MGTDRPTGGSEQNLANFGTNFLSQFEHVIRNPDGKELKYFQLFGAAVRITQMEKVRSDTYFPEWKPALIPPPPPPPWVRYVQR